MSRQYLPQSDGGVCDEGSLRPGGACESVYDDVLGDEREGDRQRYAPRVAGQVSRWWAPFKLLRAVQLTSPIMEGSSILSERTAECPQYPVAG